LTNDGAKIEKRRDPRLDFFRGLALVFIFLDHVPDNVASWATVRNFGFSDAAEIFVFISGYAAMVAYGGAYRRTGLAFAAAQVWRRCWQLYIAHIFVFVIFTAQIAYMAQSFKNPMFTEEMGLVAFLDQPHVVLLEAMALKFKPVNMDILPLYIVLLLFFPAALWGLARNPLPVLGASLLLYLAAHAFAWNLPAYPPGNQWFFNPLAWQLLFVIGASLGAWHGRRMPVPDSLRRFQPALAPVAACYLAFALWVVMTWHVPPLGNTMPKWLARLLYPIDKTNLDVLRMLHFLALAWVVVRLVKPHSRFLAWPASRPLLVCGRRSLHVFCLGVILSFSGHFFLVEVTGTVAAQIGVSAVGVALMVGLAYLIDWYEAGEAKSRSLARAAERPPA
jgi:hypothetical protein